MLTGNQVKWAERKNRANAARRAAYFIKNREVITARKARQEVVSDSQELRRIADKPMRVPDHRSNMNELIRRAKAGACKDCTGHFHPEAMDFDHRDPATKSFNLSRGQEHSQAAILAEIAKCDLVCSNCHRVRTARRRQGLPAILPEPEYFI